MQTQTRLAFAAQGLRVWAYLVNDFFLTEDTAPKLQEEWPNALYI